MALWCEIVLRAPEALSKINRVQIAVAALTRQLDHEPFVLRDRLRPRRIRELHAERHLTGTFLQMVTRRPTTISVHHACVASEPAVDDSGMSVESSQAAIHEIRQTPGDWLCH
jgi:hypothetical protein